MSAAFRPLRCPRRCDCVCGRRINGRGRHAAESHSIEANVATVGCIGLCAQEPLVDIEQAGTPRVTYGKVTPEMVPTIIAEHLLKGNVGTQWVVAKGSTI